MAAELDIKESIQSFSDTQVIREIIPVSKKSISKIGNEINKLIQATVSNRWRRRRQER